MPASRGGAKLTIILLPLVFIHSRESGGHAKQGVLCTSPVEDVSDEGALPKVRGQDCNPFGGVPQETHVLKDGDHILCLSEVLDEVRCGLMFSLALVVFDIDELKLVAEPNAYANKQSNQKCTSCTHGYTYPAFAAWYPDWVSSSGRLPSSR